MDEAVGLSGRSPAPALQCGSDSSRIFDLDQLIEWPDTLPDYQIMDWRMDFDGFVRCSNVICIKAFSMRVLVTL